MSCKFTKNGDFSWEVHQAKMVISYDLNLMGGFFPIKMVISWGLTMGIVEPTKKNWVFDGDSNGIWME